MTLFIRATEFNPTNPSKKLRLEVPGFGDASPYMKAAKLEMERASREVMSHAYHPMRYAGILWL